MKSVEFSVISGLRQLFLDSAGISRIERLIRTMHQPDKVGPVLKADRRSDGDGVHTASAPMWIEDEKVYKLVYEIRSYERKEKRYALAISEDGIAWHKPILGLVDFEESTRNNIFPTPDHQRVWHVIYDPDDDDDERRYKGFLTVPKGRIPIVSPDCIHWHKLDFNPIDLPSGDAGTLSYDRPRRRFLGLLKRRNSHNVGRSYDMSDSKDFEHWSKSRPIFGMDTNQDQEMAHGIIRCRLADPGFARPMYVDPDPALGWIPPEGKNHIPTWQAECYNFGVFVYEGMYLGLITVYYPTGQNLPERVNTDGFNTIQLAVSRNLEHWERLGNRQPFLETSRLDQGLVGNYDRLQLGFYNQGVVCGDEIRFYYNGMKRRASMHKYYIDGTIRDPVSLSAEERADWLEDSHSAIMLAVLRRDGFISLDAGDMDGIIQTKLFSLHGDRLMVNSDCTDGELRCQVLDSENNILASSIPVRGNRLRGELRWDTGNLRQLRGQAISLQFIIRNGSFYSYWFED